MSAGPGRTVLVGGVRVARGSRVRLRPGQSADVLDLALTGRTAEVDAVEEDLEGRVHVVVTLNSGEVHGRATGIQRSPFTSFGKKIDVGLGMISKSSRKQTSTVLRQQCEGAGVPFSSQRRVWQSSTYQVGT